MPGIYKLFTAIVALIGNISLIATGEMSPVFSIIGTGLLWGYYRSLKGYPSLPKRAIGGLTFTTFIVFLINFYLTGDIFIAVAQMTLIFQTLKSFDIKEPWDPLQVFFVSLLQLLMASELTLSISFGIVFLVFLIFIVVSILLGHFVKEGQAVFKPYLKPIIFITLLTLILTIGFFVTIPRFISGLWGKSFLKGIKTAGFSERVDFGSFGEVKLDETVVMRVTLEPETKDPLYLRGMTFDFFDGVSWYDTTKDMRRLYRRSGDFIREISEDDKKYEAAVYLEPIDSDVIFTIKKPYRIDSAGYYMRRDSAWSFYMSQKASKRFSYRMFSIDDYYRDNVFLKSYLQFPDEMESIKHLTGNITSNTPGTFEKANLIKEYLINNYKYSLVSERPDDGSSAVEHFLFNSRRGYCEHFATAMTLMARAEGIPARLVTGFLRGRKNTFGDYYLIRQSDAHSWVETYIDGKWITFDPTPPVADSKKVSLFLLLDMVNMNWNRYVVGFSSYDQRRMTSYFLGFRKGVGAVSGLPSFTIIPAGVIVVFLFLYYLKRRRGLSYSRSSGASAEYVQFMKRVSRYGGKVTPSSSTGEVYGEALKTGRFERGIVQKFIESYRLLRFSGRGDKDILRNFQQLSRMLRIIKHKTVFRGH
jgi:transglutaminase-like putative cysteine protease